MIDLHTHTNRSDGTVSPLELIEQAVAQGLEALAITDHDTFAGYQEAAPVAARLGLELICGVELSTRPHVGMQADRAPSVHVMGYFLEAAPSPSFQTWLSSQQDSRRERNRALIARLRELGVNITLSEVEEIGGSLAGRPHLPAFCSRKDTWVRAKKHSMPIWPMAPGRPWSGKSPDC